MVTDLELLQSAPRRDDARTFCLVLFPAHYGEQVEAILDSVGVPGYSRTHDVVGRGPRGHHFDNAVWPDATGEIFTIVNDECAHELARQLTALNATLSAQTHGLYGLHVLTWACRALL